MTAPVTARHSYSSFNNQISRRPQCVTAASVFGKRIFTRKFIVKHLRGRNVLTESDGTCSIFELANFKWTSGSRDELGKYEFGKKQWSHGFCKTCGCALVITGAYIFHNLGCKVVDRKYPPFVGSDHVNVPVNPKILVNLRSVDDIDIKALEIEEYDGKSVPIDD